MPDGCASKRGQDKDNQSQLVDKLYQQIGKLPTECEWLKKKSEVFKFLSEEGFD